MTGTFEIYTIGGGYYLYTVFNYLAAFTASTDFKLFMSIAIMIGSLGLAWKMIWGAGLRDILSSVILMMLVGLGGMGIKSRVVIIDPAAGTVPIYGIVNNVPWAVALVAHFTTETSYFLTERMETMLAAPDNLSYQKSGMLFGATLMSQAARYRAISPKVHELLVNYAQGCVLDATLLGHMDLQEVASTGSLETYIGSNMPQSLAYYDPITAKTQTCAERWAAVKGILTTEVNTVIMHHAAAAYPGSRDNGGQNIAKLKGTLSDFQYMIGMSSTNSVATIKQAMLLTATDDSLSRFIATSGNDAAMALYQKARTDIQTKSSYSAIGGSALKWVPLLKIALETVYYGAFPLALFMMMTPMGMSVLKGYFGGFVWLASWGPISALLHWIVLESASGYYRSAGLTTSDGTVNDVVLSLSNLYQMQAVEADVGSVAGYLMMSVPFLATAIMFGAGKMTSMATSLLNVGQGAAIETGREAATGSINLGNVSMNNMAANKWNTSTVVDAGRYTGFKSNGASYTVNEDGSTTYGKGSSISDFGNTAALESAVRSEVSQRAETTRTAAATATAEFSSYLTGASAQTMGFANAVTSNLGTSESGSVDLSESRKNEVARSWSVMEDFAKTNNVSTQVALDAALAGKAGINLGALAGGLIAAEGDASGRLSAAASNEDLISLAEKAARDEKVMGALDSIESARESSGWTTGKSESFSSDQGQRYSLDEGERRANAMIRSISEAEVAAAGLAYVESSGAMNSVNLNNRVQKELEERGRKPWEVLNSSNPEDVAILKDITRELADGITAQGVIEASSKVDSFSLSDPSIDRPITMPSPSGPVELGGVSLDAAGMREETRQGVASQKEAVSDEMSLKDNTADSNALRDKTRDRTQSIVESADSSMAVRLGSKVISSTAELLGISDSQAAYLLANDPELTGPRSSDRIVELREDHDQLNGMLSGAPLAGPDGKPAPLPQASEKAPAPTAPANPSQGSDAPFTPISFNPNESLRERAAAILPPGTEPIDLNQPVAGYGPEERDAMIRSILATSPSMSAGGLLGTALGLQSGEISPSSKSYNVDPESRAYQQAAYAADLVMSGAVDALPDELRNDNYLMMSGGGRMADLIVETALAVGTSPLDLATAISYETGGTFNPQQKGPVTQWGQHEGLIQFGEPQAAKYGVDFSSSEAALMSQLGADGAVANYLRDNGFEPGMGFADLYSTINAGGPGRYNRTDENNGGAPGSVMDKVNSEEMAAHRAKAAALLGITAGGQDV